MSGVWGQKIKYSIFGESHGSGIGIVIDGIKPGIKLDMDFILSEMKRRAPGQDTFSTARKEEDVPEIISGLYNGFTTGTPLCAIIRNKDNHSQDYKSINTLLRPGHADYSGSIKYEGFNDPRGGGHFSGRITAPLVFAGAVCKQQLKDKGIEILSHIASIGSIKDKTFNPMGLTDEEKELLIGSRFPVLDDKAGEKMKEIIAKAKDELNSVGGTIETCVLNIPAGLGDPFFDSVESLISHIVFSVPGVKGLEFGKGFGISELTGDEANDEYYADGDKIMTYTNNNGGILGGITNGMPILFRTAMKPTPSIARKQRTVDVSEMKNSEIEIKGRHDPCIVPRALPVIEAAAAIAVLELME